MHKILITINILLFITKSLFSQTQVIGGNVAPMAEMNNYNLVDCGIRQVRIYLNSYVGNKEFDILKKSWQGVSEDDTVALSLIETYSYSYGNFSLEIPSQYFNDTLVFEHWAYKRKKIAVNELLGYKGTTVYMQEETILLPSSKITWWKKEKQPTEQLNNPKYTTLKEKEKFSTQPIPSFPGGTDKVGLYIRKKIKEEKIRIKKPLIVEFKVTLTGKIEEVHVLGDNKVKTNKKVKHVVENSIKWKPGPCTGPGIECRFALPFIP